MAQGSMPVLVGVGQVVDHWDGSQPIEDAPSPLSLCIDASTRALADAGISAADVDTVCVTRTTDDSYPNARYPHGKNTNYPGTLSEALGMSPEAAIYSISGGQTGQQNINEMASRIYAGETECALISGSEAVKSSKAARKLGLEIDWTGESDRPFDDRGLGSRLVNKTEIAHGLFIPAWFYAMIENALAAKAGRTRTEHRQAISELWEPFAQTALQNPYSQFKIDFDAAFLATPSRKNYPFADPLLKWHMAQDAVNLGAALIIMSEDKADALGIPTEKRVYLHGSGEAEDSFFVERESYTESWAMKTALDRALAQAGMAASDMDLFDLYSCFPCAVTCATQALGIDPASDPRALTVTGGLPFFGGPGNNYSMHGVATMAEKLRANQGQYGLVLANGGWMSKEAAGIWSSARPDTFTPTETIAKRRSEDLVPTETAPTSGTVETFTVTYGKDGPDKGLLMVRTSEGKRFLALAADTALPRLLEEDSPIGLPVNVTSTEPVNVVEFA
ncbi:MAG: acetyl-CoA acetyltransferase [Henriciella sp.]|nr:acetyl-CoA acetyltransferase [Henriciella sp.]